MVSPTCLLNLLLSLCPFSMSPRFTSKREEGGGAFSLVLRNAETWEEMARQLDLILAAASPLAGLPWLRA